MYEFIITTKDIFFLLGGAVMFTFAMPLVQASLLISARKLFLLKKRNVKI